MESSKQGVAWEYRLLKRVKMLDYVPTWAAKCMKSLWTVEINNSLSTF